jgi:hypothetical protein
MSFVKKIRKASKRSPATSLAYMFLINQSPLFSDKDRKQAKEYFVQDASKQVAKHVSKATSKAIKGFFDE